MISQFDEDIEVDRPIIGVEHDYKGEELLTYHSHRRGQLLYASSGVMTVTTKNGIWVVPPLKAVWIPPGKLHKVSFTAPVSLRTLYFSKRYCMRMRRECCSIFVSPLLRELILEAMKLPRLYPLGGAEERIMIMICDQLETMKEVPLNLPIPKEPRLRRIYTSLWNNPGDRRTLEEWGKEVGAARRTLARLFQAETSMTFGVWKRQIILQQSLARLANNESVTTVAIDMGYDCPSAFISMFKKYMGKSPGRYFSEIH